MEFTLDVSSLAFLSGAGGYFFRLRQKALFGKQGKVLNLDHLYFDIVSDLELRISDFANLGIFTLVESSLQISYFLCKTNPILSAVGGLQTQYVQRIMKIYGRGESEKTNPIQTQFLQSPK